MTTEATNEMMSETQGFPMRDQETNVNKPDLKTMATEETNEMMSEMTTTNPWQVDSVQAFVCLKCPECTFDAKTGEVFRDHALENHPLSFVLFGKTLKEEGDFDPTKSADQLRSVLDFNLDTIGIKQELTEGNNGGASIYKNKHHCSICKATFPKRYILKNHINQVHLDIRPHECTECGLKFKVKHHLKKHLKRAHPEFDPDPGNLLRGINICFVSIFLYFNLKKKCFLQK